MFASTIHLPSFVPEEEWSFQLAVQLKWIGPRMYGS